MWFFWRTYHPFLMCLEAIWPNDGWVILVKTMEFFTIFLGSNGNASNEKGPGNFRCVHRPWSWSVASYTAEMGKNTSSKKTAIRNDPISRGIAKFINLYWEMVYGSGYRTSKTNSHRWWNCQVGWDWKWYHADLSERPGADFAEELQMTRWLCDLFAKISPKNLQVYDLED